MSLMDIIIAGLAAIAAGIVNAVAGGGTLITFPVLIALGLPAVSANVTNTVALCPGYFGGTWAQRKDLTGQGGRIRLLVPVAILGGIAGGLLLILTGEKLFSSLVPYLILFATLLLAAQDHLKKWIFRNSGPLHADGSDKLIIFAMVPAALYGGYFGAGLGVITIAALGLFLHDNIVRLNALKQLISLCINIAAAIYFLFSGHVHWLLAGVMAVCALAGGYLGGKLAGKFKPSILRWAIVAIGLIVAVIYFFK
jgi:uncharacterized membrane protein YfcA